jgi:2-iminobutanoate/2-iminopropanoate deaminase
MDRSEVKTAMAPAAVGPYSQALRVGEFVFCSGQIPLDPESGELVGPAFADQARRVLENLQAVLAAAGLGMSDVVKTTIYLVDLGDFSTLNNLYQRVFSAPFPARATVQVAALPRGALIEIEAIACGPKC